MARKKKVPKEEEEGQEVPEVLHYSTHCPDGKPHVLHGNFYVGLPIGNMNENQWYDRDMMCVRCGYRSWNRLTPQEFTELKRGNITGTLAVTPKTPFKVNPDFKPLNGDI